MCKNIEFDYIGVPSPLDFERVVKFFEYCDDRATAVDCDLIQFYKDNQAEIDNEQKRIKYRLPKYSKKNDPFSADRYDLSNTYFTFEDYEIFFERNANKNDTNIKTKRKNVQKKMLALHKIVYPTINEAGLHCHKSEKHITSNIDLGWWNDNALSWIGIRYGKPATEVDALNYSLQEKDVAYGFQKHGCLQFSIFPENFNIIFFFAVKNGAIDRMKMSQNNYAMLKERRVQIENALDNLKGHGFEWYISKKDLPSFNLDERLSNEFYDWFKQNDDDGYESYLRKSYNPDNPILKSKEAISSEILRIIPVLKPIYDAMVWRPNL